MAIASGLNSRIFIARNRKARSADLKLARDPAGDQASERTHRPIGRQCRRAHRAELVNPVRELIGWSDPGRVLCSSAPGLRAATSAVVIGRIQIEPDPDQHAGSRCQARCQCASHKACAATSSMSDCWGNISTSSLGGIRN